MKVLCGDIGGTKVLLAMRDPDGRMGAVRRYESKKFPTFDAVLREYMKDAAEKPAAAVFAVAGPVIDDVCKATQLPWILDGRELERSLSIGKVRLINDFTAQALAVLGFAASDLAQLCPGERVANGPIAVLGAGTGLGQAFLVHTGTRYEVIPSEGGHTDFAPTSERQIDLLRYLQTKLGGRVSYERVLSGAGLVAIYSYLRDRKYGPDKAEVRDAMQKEDPAAVVSRMALAGTCDVCVTALDIFAEIYGQEAGNLALKVLATGGVYVCGGIAAKILGKLEDGTFQRAYRDKGRLTRVVETIPVHVVKVAESGLIGAGVFATRM